MERSIQQLPRLILLIAIAALCTIANGQEAGPPNSAPPVVSDQLSPRRGFPPLPVNDLRNTPARQTEAAPFSAPTLPVTPSSPSAAPSIPDFDSGVGNTSGSFLRPVAPNREPAVNSATLSPQRAATAELPAAAQTETPAAGSFGKNNSPSALNPNGSGLNASRPIEIIADSTIVDSAVKPAAGYSPLGAAVSALPGETNRMRGMSPAELARQQLDRYSISRASEPLPGQPLKLEDLLQSMPPDRRRNIVRQYWNTYGAWANYHDCSEVCARLDSIGLGSDPNQAKLLETTRMRASDDRLQAEIRLQQAQSELQRLLPSAGSDLLPLPADQPLVEAYETHADWYIANGQLPPNLRTVSRSLPLQQKLICQRAVTADTAMMNSQLAGQAHSAMQCDLLTLLGTLELSSQSRQAFLQSVLDYNQAIADYSLGIAPASQPPAMIASMLVAPSLPAKGDSQSVLAEVPASSGDRWAGTPTQPRSIRTAPGATTNSPPQQAPARVDSNPSSGFAAPPVNPPAPSGQAPGFGLPPATGFGPAMSNPAPARFEPATSSSNPAPLAPAGNSAGGFNAPALPSSPPPSGNPAGSFSPLPTGGPAFGPAPSSGSEKSPPAPAPPTSGGTQFKLGG